MALEQGMTGMDLRNRFPPVSGRGARQAQSARYRASCHQDSPAARPLQSHVGCSASNLYFIAGTQGPRRASEIIFSP